MVFEKKVQLHYENLSEGTKLRFIELEINAALNLLAKGLFSYHKTPLTVAIETITSALVPDIEKKALREDLAHTFNNFRFRKPQREEMIHYFRYKRIGVAKVVKYARVAPNTVQAMKDDHPNLTPVYPSWLGFPGLIKRWDELKNDFNFFNDDLIQGKDSHVLQLSQEKINEDEPEQITPSNEPLEPLGIWEAGKKFPPIGHHEIDIILPYVAAYGHTGLDDYYRDYIYNGHANLIELGVIDYIQDPEEKAEILKIYSR